MGRNIVCVANPAAFKISVKFPYVAGLRYSVSPRTATKLAAPTRTPLRSIQRLSDGLIGSLVSRNPWPGPPSSVTFRACHPFWKALALRRRRGPAGAARDGQTYNRRRSGPKSGGVSRACAMGFPGESGLWHALRARRGRPMLSGASQRRDAPECRERFIKRYFDRNSGLLNSV